MQVHSFGYDLDTKAWSVPTLPVVDSTRTLVLAFGAPEVAQDPTSLGALARAYPRSIVVGCSSAGEIHGTTVRDRSISVTATKFDKTDLVLVSMDVGGPQDSFTTGQALAKNLAAKPGLRAVLVLSEGLNVNGSELVRGLSSALDESVVVTGGLSGDGYRFQSTWVAVGGKVKPNLVAAIGFYGDFVQVGHGSKGGWDKFGPERLVTRSEGNILYELDGKPALKLYKEYLGDKAKDLPSSGLLFPLSLRASSKDEKFLVRTLLAVDHEKNSLTFAGDIPKGYLAQLMKADFDRLIGGAASATTMVKETGTPVGKDSLVVAISCVGRRLVLGERIEEEVEAVLDAMPKEQTNHLTGFYSYGELSPYASSGACDLHNQTMTLTVFSESATPLPRRAPAPAPVAAAAAPQNREANRTTARPPPPPPPPSPPARPVRSPIQDDLDLETSNTNTQALPPLTGFHLESFSYDLDTKAWSVPKLPPVDSARTLVLAFGSPDVIDAPEAMAELARAYPKSVLLGCSSAGEIHGTSVRDRSISVSAARFEKTDLLGAAMDVTGPQDSFATGEALARKLAARPGLRAVLVLSEGLNVNGSELVRGMNSALDESVVITGGLSGDGYAFKRTWVAYGGKLKGNQVAAVGLYGDHIQIGHGSKGGWDKFGPERLVTRSEGNVLHELDGKPALKLYKEYLGDKAKDLPSSGLLFPLSLRASSKDEKFLVRTLLAVDHEKNTLTFAGDIPKGYLAQLMKADFDRLIGGAAGATKMVADTGAAVGTEALVVAISCVGRRLVLGERTEEEVEAVLDAMPKEQTSHITGFYSYGELSPYAAGACDLHNQTMTLTVFSESKTPLPRKKNTSDIRSTQAVRRPALPPPTRPSVPATSATSLLAPLLPESTPSISVVSQRRVGPVTRLSAAGSNVQNAVVKKERRGDVTLVTVSGRLTEAFKGDALGRELKGTVAIDLAGVERITSFGVREWLSMLGAMQDVKRLYFLRCSEPIVNQLGMIRKFCGTAQIVSFFAPYLCGSCGESFERELDCERDADAIREGRADEVACPACSAMGKFDDDARSYFAFAAPHLSSAVPVEIRAVLDELDAMPLSVPREGIDKTVEGNVTRVRVQSKLGASVRWKRVLDGIEGALAIDLGAVTGVDPAGLANLEQALGGLGMEVTSTVIERCPAILVERFVQAGLPPRVTVTSAMLDARCPSCAVARTALVSVQEHGEALASGQVPRVHCKRCNGELQLENPGRALAFLKDQLKPESSTSSRKQDLAAASLGGMAVSSSPSLGNAAPSGAYPTATLPAFVPPARPAMKPAMIAAFAALAVAVIGLVVVIATRAPAPTAVAAAGSGSAAPVPLVSAAPAATQASGWMQTVDLPPSWVERPFVIDGADVFVVGKSDFSATPELAMSTARNDAIVRLMKQMQGELAGSPVAEFLAARVRDTDHGANDAIAGRYLKQFGTTASPERVDAALRKRESGVEGFARYRLAKSVYQQVLAGYRDTTQLQGMTVARFFPLLEQTLHTDGDLVVLSTQRGRAAAEQGVRAGDVVLAISGRPVASVDTFNKVSADEWAQTPVRGTMSVDIESAGAKRTVRFFKPAPTQ